MVNAEIRAQVSGYLLSKNYNEGSYVRNGQLLFEIDARPFQAALDQAKAETSPGQKGMLTQGEGRNFYRPTRSSHSARPIRARTQLDVTRYTPLAEGEGYHRSGTRQCRPGQSRRQGPSQSGRAGIETAKAAIVAAKAASQRQAEPRGRRKLNLGFTRIISPIDGIAGIARRRSATWSARPATALTTVSTVDPIKVYFTPSRAGVSQLHQTNPDSKRTRGHAQAGSSWSWYSPMARLIRRRAVLRRGPAGRSEDGRDPAGRNLPEPRQHPAPRPVRPRPRRDQHQSRRATRAAAGRQRAAGQLPGRRCGR